MENDDNHNSVKRLKAKVTPPQPATPKSTIGYEQQILNATSTARELGLASYHHDVGDQAVRTHELVTAASATPTWFVEGMKQQQQQILQKMDDNNNKIITKVVYLFNLDARARNSKITGNADALRACVNDQGDSPIDFPQKLFDLKQCNLQKITDILGFYNLLDVDGNAEARRRRLGEHLNVPEHLR
jgi:hypothetical protein